MSAAEQRLERIKQAQAKANQARALVANREYDERTVDLLLDALLLITMTYVDLVTEVGHP